MTARAPRLATVVLAALTIGGVVACTAGSSPEPDPDATPTAMDAQPDVSGLVKLSSGRRIYIECRGTGEPTVLFISGGGLAADEWSTLAPDSDQTPVMDAIAETNRVCAYDRPGTTRVTGEPVRSDLVQLPRTLTEMAEEVRDVLRAAGENGPVVLVGHSFGSPIGRLYAGLEPDAVAGIVWVDGGHERFYEVFEKVIGPKGYDVPGVEYLLPPTLVEMREQFAAHPVPKVPAVVIEHSRDRNRIPNPMSWDPSWPVGDLEVAWQEAQVDLASLIPGTTHLVAEDSGHLIMVEQVDLVIDAIHGVLAQLPAP